VATLHEVLLKSNPAIAEDAVIQFRSGLVFIINRLHDEGAEGIQPSLLDQAKLLDDEGYDSHTLLTILNKVTEATIGSSATQELLSYIQENAAVLDGLPFLLDHVHSSFPELARAIDELETLAFEEENQLLAMAGGMSKKVEVPLIAGVVTTVGIAAVAGYRKRKSMLAERAVREEQAAKDEVHNYLSKKDIARYWGDNKDYLLQDAIKKGANANTIDAIIRDPNLLIKQSKSLESLAAGDIEGYAEQLALRHFLKFEAALKPQVEEAFAGELSKFEISLRDSSEFRNEFKSRLEQRGLDGNLSWDDIKKLPEYNEIESDALNVNNWSQAQVERYIRDTGGSLNAMKNAFDEIKDSYAAQLREEINAAKRDVFNQATAKLEDALWNIDEQGNYMRRAELKLDSDIVSKTKELREAFASDARVVEREVDAKVEAAVRDGRSAAGLL